MTQEEEKQIFKEIFEKSTHRKDTLNKVKNRFNNDPLKLIAFIKNNGNLEDEDLVTGFKRFNFTHKEVFEISKLDYYGNVVVYTKIPKTICTLCLMIIHNLTERGYDRYNTIMDLQDIFRSKKDLTNIIDTIENVYKQH